MFQREAGYFFAFNVTCRVTRSKLATSQKLRNAVPTPTLFQSAEEIGKFPVFLKPDRGQGAQRTGRAKDQEELQAMLRADPDRLLLEYLPGKEYTVDCFSDRDRGLLYAAGRERRRVRNGIAMDCAFVEDPRFHDYATRINAELELFTALGFFRSRKMATGS